MIYRRRASPLHSARASVAVAWCAGLGIAALIVSDPVFLAALALAVMLAALLAGVGRQLGRALRWALPAALAIAVINALVTRDGLTVIWRFGTLPVVGYWYVTAEALAYGAILGLRAVILILCGVVYTTCVDPDELLSLFRRVSFRSALSATLATRLVPLLARDASRLTDAQRCRPGRPPSRLALMRAASSNMLDRALDVAAALEVRGYGAARRQARSGGHAPGRDTTSRSARRRSRCRRWRSPAVSRERCGSVPTRRCRLRVDPPRSRCRWRCSYARWRRSPIVGGSSDERRFV